jgi:hypothetical protein
MVHWGSGGCCIPRACVRRQRGGVENIYPPQSPLHPARARRLRGGARINTPPATRLHPARAKANQSAGGGDQKSGCQKSDKAIAPIDTKKEIAKVASYAICDMDSSCSLQLVTAKNGVKRGAENLRKPRKIRVFQSVQEASKEFQNRCNRPLCHPSE